jgi:hypothetical protein
MRGPFIVGVCNLYSIKGAANRLPPDLIFVRRRGDDVNVLMPFGRLFVGVLSRVVLRICMTG